MKLEQIKDNLYCKEQKKKAELCRKENQRLFGNIKKRHSNAKKRAIKLVTTANDVTSMSMHDEMDDRGITAWDAVARTRAINAKAANEAALAAIEYLELCGFIYKKREARALLKDEDPDVVCFPASIAEKSRRLLTLAQEHMRYLEQRLTAKKSGADCVAQQVEKLSHMKERKENRIPCEAFESLKGDPGVRLWFDPSETKKATFDMNKVIVDSNELLAFANRTLFEELPKSKKDAMAIANAEEIAKCKERALRITNDLATSQKKHDLRDVAFEEGDLCNADIRTAFIEYNAAMRHSTIRSTRVSNRQLNTKLRGNTKAARRQHKLDVSL